MWTHIKKYISYLYLHYELATCIYMFEPWEKKFINGFVLIILALLTFSSFVYLPSYTETLLKLLSPTETIGEVHVPSPQRFPIN